MKNVIRFVVMFFVFYLIFDRMRIWVHVHMNAWQFIVFLVVLSLMVEYAIEKLFSKSGS